MSKNNLKIAEAEYTVKIYETRLKQAKKECADSANIPEREKQNIRQKIRYYKNKLEKAELELCRLRLFDEEYLKQNIS